MAADRRRLLPVLRRAAALRGGRTPADARDRRDRGARLHARDLTRGRGAACRARDRAARCGSRLAGDALDQLEHRRSGRGDPRRRARAPRRTLEDGTHAPGCGRCGRRRGRGGSGLGRARRREGRVSRLGDVGALEQERAPDQRRLRLGLELRRPDLARAQDDGADDRGAADLALLARDDARRLQRRLLARVDARGAAGPALRPADAGRRPQRGAATSRAREGRGAPGQPADRRVRARALRARRRGRVRALPVDRHRVCPPRRPARLHLHVVELRAATVAAGACALPTDLLLRARSLPRRADAHLDPAGTALRHAGTARGDGPDLRREPVARLLSPALRARACDRGRRPEPVRGGRRSSRRRSGTDKATSTTRIRPRGGTCRPSSSS